MPLPFHSKECDECRLDSVLHFEDAGVERMLLFLCPIQAVSKLDLVFLEMHKLLHP